MGRPLGYKLSDETRKKIGQANKISLIGKKQSAETIQKRVAKIKGKKRTSATKEKMRESAIKRKMKFGWIINPETVRKSIQAKKINVANGGTWHSIAARKKLSEALRGKKSHLWKGGVTPLNKKIRTSFEYREWRRLVFKRDNFTCMNCGKRGGNLEAHHIKSFSKHKELRFEINNGQTLCVECHKKIDKCRN